MRKRGRRCASRYRCMSFSMPYCAKAAIIAARSISLHALLKSTLTQMCVGNACMLIQTIKSWVWVPAEVIFPSFKGWQALRKAAFFSKSTHLPMARRPSHRTPQGVRRVQLGWPLCLDRGELNYHSPHHVKPEG